MLLSLAALIWLVLNETCDLLSSLQDASSLELYLSVVYCFSLYSETVHLHSGWNIADVIKFHATYILWTVFIHLPDSICAEINIYSGRLLLELHISAHKLKMKLNKIIEKMKKRWQLFQLPVMHGYVWMSLLSFWKSTWYFDLISKYLHSSNSSFVLKIQSLILKDAKKLSSETRGNNHMSRMWLLQIK